MHKVLDSFLVKLPIDTQNGVAPKVCDPPIIPHFCGFVNRQNAQKNKRKTAIFSTGLRNFGETAQKFGARFVEIAQTFCRVAQIRGGDFVPFAQKEKSPLIRGLNCCEGYGITHHLWE